MTAAPRYEIRHRVQTDAVQAIPPGIEPYAQWDRLRTRFPASPIALVEIRPCGAERVVEVAGAGE